MAFKDKNIYLETSAIRLLINHLHNPIIKARCFTSTLTLLELITDLKKDFNIRKYCVGKILANITIDWQFPEAIIAEAFPLLKCQEKRVYDFQLICLLLAGAKSYEVFAKEIESLNLTYDLTYFTDTDNYHAYNFVKNSSGITDDVKNLLKKDSDSRTIQFDKPLKINKRKDFFKLHTDYRKYNEGWTIMALSDMYAKALKNDEDETKADELYNCYNGKVSFYITAYSYYDILKISKGNVSSINDRTDLEHFLYLRNDPSIRISSNDKLIQSICSELWKEKYVDPKELLSNF